MYKIKIDIGKLADYESAFTELKELYKGLYIIYIFI